MGYPVEIEAVNADGSYHVHWTDEERQTRKFYGQLRKCSKPSFPRELMETCLSFAFYQQEAENFRLHFPKMFKHFEGVCVKVTCRPRRASDAYFGRFGDQNPDF